MLPGLFPSFKFDVLHSERVSVFTPSFDLRIGNPRTKSDIYVGLIFGHSTLTPLYTQSVAVR